MLLYMPLDVILEYTNSDNQGSLFFLSFHSKIVEMKRNMNNSSRKSHHCPLVGKKRLALFKAIRSLI